MPRLQRVALRLWRAVYAIRCQLHSGPRRGTRNVRCIRSARCDLPHGSERHLQRVHHTTLSKPRARQELRSDAGGTIPTGACRRLHQVSGGIFRAPCTYRLSCPGAHGFDQLPPPSSCRYRLCLCNHWARWCLLLLLLLTPFHKPHLRGRAPPQLNHLNKWINELHRGWATTTQTCFSRRRGWLHCFLRIGGKRKGMNAALQGHYRRIGRASKTDENTSSMIGTICLCEHTPESMYDACSDSLTCVLLAHQLGWRRLEATKKRKDRLLLRFLFLRLLLARPASATATDGRRS